MTGSGLDSSLLESQGSTCCGGLKRDCRGWIQWRSPDGSNGTRWPWQLLCSVLLIGELIPYFMCVKDSWVLCVIGAFFLIKGMVEVWGQQTPTWIAPASLFMLLLMYIGILPTISYMYGYCTMTCDITFQGRDIVALVLYFGGSLFSLTYEVGRFRWKAQPENKGKLHTVGLAAWCIHPNYLGDLFTYTGWALASGTTCALSIPILMICTFVLLVIPNSDNYLAERYPKEFPAYAEKTATLIPGLRSKLLSQILSWLCLATSVYLWIFACPAPCGY